MGSGYDVAVQPPIHYQRMGASHVAPNTPGSMYLQVGPAPDGGTFDLTFTTDGDARAFNDVPFDIDGAGLQALLNAEFGAGVATVSGDSIATGFGIEFSVGNGVLPLDNVNLDITNLTGDPAPEPSTNVSAGAEDVVGPVGTKVVRTSDGTSAGSPIALWERLGTGEGPWVQVWSD